MREEKIFLMATSIEMIYQFFLISHCLQNSILVFGWSVIIDQIEGLSPNLN